MFDFLGNLLQQLIDIMQQIIGSATRGNPGNTPDCSDWIAPGAWHQDGTWPDGSPIPEDIVCGDA